MWYTVKIKFYVNDRPAVTFCEKNYWFKQNALDYIDSIESVGVHANCSLEELISMGLRAKVELYDRKDNFIFAKRLVIEHDEDSRLEVMQA